ncbi:MAG: sugar phosphate nucleotidyltransferase [Prevotellaceae bacterium]|nr:sugar phosphate nucleotidyltransferase [Prevotellaceae bacterium]
MKYAVIAAGEGSRLAKEGVNDPKPLVRINGERLVDRLIRVFMENGAEEIVIICNDFMAGVKEHLETIQREGLDGKNIPLQLVVKSTPSSMHSFFEISRYLTDAPFCLTTVDTIFREDDFKRYISAFQACINDGNADGMMGVTDYIDDEKPLYVSTDESLNITGFLDKDNECRFISGGIYGLTPKSIDILKRCIERGESRMRNFQRALVNEGCSLKAYPFSKVLDIDHASDIQKAEQFLNSEA